MRNSESWRGKIGGMSDAEMNEFLAGNIVCRLGCLDGDGWPYVVPIWYEYSDSGFYIVPRERSLWAKYIQNDPRVSICIDQAEGLRKVMAKGKGEIVEEPNVGGRWVEIARQMALRYYGANGPSYLEPTMSWKRWLIRLDPVETWTWQGIAWPKRYLEGDAVAR